MADRDCVLEALKSFDGFYAECTDLSPAEIVAFAKMLIYEDGNGDWSKYDAGHITDSPHGQRVVAKSLGISMRTFRAVIRKKFVLRVDFQWRSRLAHPDSTCAFLGGAP